MKDYARVLGKSHERRTNANYPRRALVLFLLSADIDEKIRKSPKHKTAMNAKH